MPVYLLAAVLFLVGIAIFVFQNTTPVTVHFLNWISPEISLAVVVLITACTGALITFLLDTFRYFKFAKRIKELTTTNSKLQQEVDSQEKKYQELKESINNNEQNAGGE